MNWDSNNRQRADEVSRRATLNECKSRNIPQTEQKSSQKIYESEGMGKASTLPTTAILAYRHFLAILFKIRHEWLQILLHNHTLVEAI